jgi:hypothetical protein
VNLKPYTGPSAKLNDPLLAAVLKENSTISMTIYPKGTVDHQFFLDAVVLTPETTRALYADFTPLEQTYERGSRPILESIAKKVTAGCATPRERALALLDWCRDIPFLAPPPENKTPFHGGTEEEVIKKSSDMCNEKARVLGVLSQIAGIPSRYIGHMIPILDYDDPRQNTGHGVNELFIDGSWAYVDTSGKFYLKANGQLASAQDLIDDPGLIDRQPEAVLRHLRAGQNQSNTRRYFSATTVHIVVNYLVNDAARYDFSWIWATDEVWQKGRAAGRAIREREHQGIFDLLPAYASV